MTTDLENALRDGYTELRMSREVDVVFNRGDQLRRRHRVRLSMTATAIVVAGLGGAALVGWPAPSAGPSGRAGSPTSGSLQLVSLAERHVAAATDTCRRLVTAGGQDWPWGDPVAAARTDRAEVLMYRDSERTAECVVAGGPNVDEPLALWSTSCYDGDCPAAFGSAPERGATMPSVGAVQLRDSDEVVDVFGWGLVAADVAKVEIRIGERVITGAVRNGIYAFWGDDVIYEDVVNALMVTATEHDGDVFTTPLPEGG